MPQPTQELHSNIRTATSADVPAISDIYNYYVLHSTCTYATEPESLADREAWFRDRSAKHPAIVAEIDGQVAGWASLSRWNSRTGYDRTVEFSVYIRHDMHRRGLGRALLMELIRLAKAAGHHTILGGASADQTASIALQEAMGFKQVSLFRQTGFKFGRWLDVVHLQLMLD